jgi:hypothetical protein
MTERRTSSARRTVGLVTTAVVSLGAAAAVGWAAAMPVGGAGASATAGSGTPASTVRTAQQVDAARANLEQVRRDLTRLVGREDPLPRARLANLSATLAQLPTVQVPQSPTQPTVTQAAPPVSHTTTGASGARP